MIAWLRNLLRSWLGIDALEKRVSDVQNREVNEAIREAEEAIRSIEEEIYREPKEPGDEIVEMFNGCRQEGLKAIDAFLGEEQEDES